MLYHDEFSRLQAQLLARLKSGSAAGAGLEELEVQARALVVDFIRARLTQLPDFSLEV